MKQQRATVAGYSLIETLFATALICILTLGLVQLLLFSGRLSAAAREEIQALEVIESKMESIRSCCWDELASPSKSIPARQFLATNGLVYHGSIDIRKAPLTETYRDNLLQVTVKVTWGAGKRSKELEISTFISPYGTCAAPNQH